MHEYGPNKVPLTLNVNGRRQTLEIEPRRTLLEALRIDLGLTGTKLVCNMGNCGACTVVVDGVLTRACLMLAVQADGAMIRTVEGLASPDGVLHPVQEAFWARHGLQCGFCTPGMLTTLATVLDDNPHLDEAAIRDAISGHICRCTGYESIVDAALEAAAVLRGGA